MKPRDRCQLCKGARGGVPGNENRIGGLVVCDYCSVGMLPGTKQLDLLAGLGREPVVPTASLPVAPTASPPKVLERVEPEPVVPVAAAIQPDLLTEHATALTKALRVQINAALIGAKPKDGSVTLDEWPGIKKGWWMVIANAATEHRREVVKVVSREGGPKGTVILCSIVKDKGGPKERALRGQVRVRRMDTLFLWCETKPKAKPQQAAKPKRAKAAT